MAPVISLLGTLLVLKASKGNGFKLIALTGVVLISILFCYQTLGERVQKGWDTETTLVYFLALSVTPIVTVITHSLVKQIKIVMAAIVGTVSIFMYPFNLLVLICYILHDCP